MKPQPVEQPARHSRLISTHPVEIGEILGSTERLERSRMDIMKNVLVLLGCAGNDGYDKHQPLLSTYRSLLPRFTKREAMSPTDHGPFQPLSLFAPKIPPWFVSERGTPFFWSPKEWKPSSIAQFPSWLLSHPSTRVPSTDPSTATDRIFRFGKASAGSSPRLAMSRSKASCPASKVSAAGRIHSTSLESKI